jgi:cation/acetate symporter
VASSVRHLIQAKAWYPLENPAIVSVPLGFPGAWLGTLVSRDTSLEAKFDELLVRSNTGLVAEQA